jgi:hypothetical protein
MRLQEPLLLIFIQKAVMNQSETTPERSLMAQRDILPRMGAGCLLLLGTTIIVIAATYLSSPADFDIPGFIFYGLIGAGFGVSGIFWLRYISALEETRRNLFAEKAVLRVAARNGGSVTIAEISLDSPLTAEEAESAVERLCGRGVARAELLDDGTVEYRFSGLLRR